MLELGKSFKEIKQDNYVTNYEEVIEEKAIDNPIKNLSLDNDNHQLSINFQQSISNSNQNQIDQTEYKKYRNKFQEILNLKATDKDLEEDDLIFIKAAKKEFDPFRSNDEKQ